MLFNSYVFLFLFFLLILVLILQKKMDQVFKSEDFPQKKLVQFSKQIQSWNLLAMQQNMVRKLIILHIRICILIWKAKPMLQST